MSRLLCFWSLGAALVIGSEFISSGILALGRIIIIIMILLVIVINHFEVVTVNFMMKSIRQIILTLNIPLCIIGLYSEFVAAMLMMIKYCIYIVQKGIID